MLRSLPCLFAATVVSPFVAAQTFTWSEVQSPSSPTARVQHAMAFELGGARAVLFGGSDGQTLGDTWLWNVGLGSWSLVVPQSNPPARHSHAMAYDPLRQRVVMFGGVGAQTLGDTWEWNGSDWLQMTPANAPAARFDAAMAFDAVSGRVLLFGGSVGAVDLGDTWAWDGSNWTLLAPTSSPVARGEHALASDGAQSILLFGGRSATFGDLADTWLWNGSDWSPRLSPTTPPARHDHAMAYDPSSRRFVTYGGSGVGLFDDTWEWDGSNWSDANSPVRPTARQGHAIGYAAAANRLLMFGGSASALLGDTWQTRRAAAIYGTGCGAPPLTLLPDPAAPPFLGSVARATITQAPTMAAAIQIGFSDRFFTVFPLPLPLGSFGMPGCFLWQSAEVGGLGAQPITASTLSFAMTIPVNPSWLGQHLYLQSFAFAPGENPLQITTSNGLDWTISCPTPVVQQISEDFNNDQQLDVDASAGTWANGVAEFAQIGGDGRHGAFDISLANSTGEIVNGRMVYELDCDNTLIPATSTLSGMSELVTDGRFAFTSMRLESGEHLRLVGSLPPVLTVAGKLEILGTIDVRGASVTVPHQGAQLVGQAGASGGVFGGDGGAGGDKCTGSGPGTGQYNGRDGSDVNVLAGHAYWVNTIGTGGQGSTLYPASGLFDDQQFGTSPPFGLQYCLSSAAGGSGGGLWTAGSPGFVEGIFSAGQPLPNMMQYMGLPEPGGAAFQVLPFIPGVLSSLDHFLIGGAGGGGSASNCSLSLSLARSWASGGGGGGGGGVVGLRAGNQLILAQGAEVLATGGSAVDLMGQAAGAQVAPAGGGSGGSIVFQSGNLASLAGVINVEGGRGGVFDRQGGTGVGPQGASIRIRGGDGGAGFVRFEKPIAPTVAELGTMVPPASIDNVAAMTDFDVLVGMRSKFYATGLICDVQYQRYEIEATVNGVPMLFSDDPSVSAMQATVGAPIRALFQAGELDLTTGELGVTGPWRETAGTFGGQIGIASDGYNGFRFHLVIDRAFANSMQVDKVTVVFQ